MGESVGVVMSLEDPQKSTMRYSAICLVQGTSIKYAAASWP